MGYRVIYPNSLVVIFEIEGKVPLNIKPPRQQVLGKRVVNNEKKSTLRSSII